MTEETPHEWARRVQGELRALKPAGAGAVMASRHEPPDSLDYFPTPPWATRAFMHWIGDLGWIISRKRTVLEPACGEGHMAEVLREFFDVLIASDIHPYGYGQVADFLDPRYRLSNPPDWVITNPPFNKAIEFVEKGLEIASEGVAVLVRLAWLETEGRYEFFHKNRLSFPSLIAISSDRIPMTKGKWDPEAKTATAYVWVVFLKEPGDRRHPLLAKTGFIPPGAKKRYTLERDMKLAWRPPAPLLDQHEEGQK